MEAAMTPFTLVKTYLPLAYVIEAARGGDGPIWRTSPRLYAKLRSLRKRNRRRRKHRQRTQRLIRARYI